MMKMMTASAGMPYMHHRRSLTGNLMPLPSSASAMKFFHPQPHLLQQKIAKMMPPRGRMLLDTMKSSILEMSPIPGKATPLHTFMPNTQGMLNTANSTPLCKTARFRDQLQRSMHQVTKNSNTPMTVESAANPMNTPPDVSQTYGASCRDEYGPKARFEVLPLLFGHALLIKNNGEAACRRVRPASK